MDNSPHQANSGTWIMLVGALIAAALMAFSFFDVNSPIGYTGGAELVIITSLAISFLALLIYFFRHFHARWERVILYILSLILLLGTLFATFLLESYVCLGVLVIALLGWFIQVIKG